MPPTSVFYNSTSDGSRGSVSHASLQSITSDGSLGHPFRRISLRWMKASVGVLVSWCLVHDGRKRFGGRRALSFTLPNLLIIVRSIPSSWKE